MSAIKTKVKTGIEEVTAKPKLAIVHFVMGFVIGVIVDLILEHLVWSGLNQIWTPKDQGGYGWLPPRLEGFTIFPKNVEADTGIAWMAWDDVFLLIFSVGMFIFGWFKKGLIYIAGFTMGWYFSSYFGMYNALLKPIFFPEEVP